MKLRVPGARTSPLAGSFLIALAINWAAPTSAQFVAYNDHAPGAGTSPNATSWDVFGNPPGATGFLKDSKSGTNLPVTLTITVSEAGVLPAGTQGSPAAGTPVFNAFNGFADFQGAPNPSIELTPGGLVTYTFTGLNPNKRYTFAGSAVRGVDSYTDRWTLFEISGAESFTSAHTTNVLTTEDVQLISASQGAINTGANHTATTGDMVVWQDIAPGPEGSFSVQCQQYVGPVPGGTSEGSKGYGMTAIRLEEFDVLPKQPAFVAHPQSLTVPESHPVVFSVVAEGNPEPTLQWYRNDELIPGATGKDYTISAANLIDDGAVFKVIAANVISNVTYTATSSNAVLRVNGDFTAPTLLEVTPLSLGQVKAVFSERVTLLTATNIGNYAISSATGPLGIATVTLEPSESAVILNINPLTENTVYTLTVTGVRDQSQTGNPMPPTQKTFAAITFIPQDIGSPTNAGSLTPVPGGYDVRGSGLDIGFNRDQFHFAYQEKTGDFDMRVRVADLTITDSYVKAGLMVRESLADNARFAAAFASSAQLGSFFHLRPSSSANAQMVAPALKFPANYPWAWLRLRRSNGTNFSGFGSFDGLAWQLLGATNIAMTNQTLYFGMAVGSSASNRIATAKFRDISPVQGPTTFNYIPKRETLGPSNRRTGVIFSEVMYHARSRADGKVLDFVEIYNGNAIFMDLTGWRITGGIDYTFPNGFELGAGQFAVIAADPEAVKEAYGLTSVLGPYENNLSNSDDTLRLRNHVGAIRAEFTYDSKAPWPITPDGIGHSLVCLRPSYGEDDVRAWGASQLIGGSPGFDDPVVPHPLEGVVINELLAAPGAGETGFIELYNASNIDVDLGGCYLTDLTNKFVIPTGTGLGARRWISFTQEQVGFGFSSGGTTLFLVTADESRALDAIRCGAQEPGVSLGRTPDGGSRIRRLASVTMGLPNSNQRIEDVVINEVMYKSIRNDRNDQYIELHNRTASAVNIGGWRFNDGIDFTFPAGTQIGPNGYLVVARNAQRMMTNYPHLTAATLVGNFDGELRGNGEKVSLAKPGKNPFEFVTVYEVSYMSGGRWSSLANGNGSSLELIDPRGDPESPANWDGSDETQKSQWKTYEVSGAINQNNQTYAANKLYLMGHDTGEYLVDDIEVFRPNSTNVLTNPGFENALTGWAIYGTHRLSGVRTTGAFSGNACFYLRPVEGGDEGPNSVRGNLLTTFSTGSQVTIRLKARWLSGWPEFLARIRGNGIELPVRLEIPKNLGTPGLPNSKLVANAGPSITDVAHFPPVPAVNEAVLVTAKVSDPDGLGLVELVIRPDPGTTTSRVLMKDDGSGGDRLAGDGIYSGIIPGRQAGLVAFRIQAQDLAPTVATSVFPPTAPARECLVRWGDPTPFGSIGRYHIWATAASTSDLNSRPGQDRSYRDCTMIYDTRPIYNAGLRNKGSPFHTGVGSFSASFGEDDLFLATDRHVFRSTGNGGNEGTQMAVDVSYWIAERLGLPRNNCRYVRVYRNGALHYPVDYDMEVPDRSIAKDWYGGGGVDDTLYKIAGWFEYDDSNNGGTGSLIWASAQKKPATGPLKTAAYRFNWQSHPGGTTANDYSLIFNMVEAANATDKVTGMMNLVDMENWMRTFALRRILGDWDHWSASTGQNMYMYAPLGERAKLMNWDMDFVLGLGDGAQTGLFSAGQDSVVGNLFNVATYRRMLWRAYQDAMNGPLDKAISDAQFDSRRAMLLKNNVTTTQPTGLKSFVAGRKSYITSQIRAADAAAFVVNTPDSTTASPTATITGVAPLGVATIEVNGIPYPVTWTSPLTAWRITVPLGAVTNTLNIVGKDLRGNVYTNATKRVTFIYTGAVPNPADWVVINEINYNALATDAEFIELYNSHPSYAFDLSGFRLRGADFTFPAGTLIQPNGYLLVAKDSASFAAAYGATIPIVGEYLGRLENAGETLTLVKPGNAQTPETIIDEVQYESVFPWPAVANGFGPSLQRIDPAQDSWRAGNWASTAVNDANRTTPGRANITRSILSPFPQIWLNEVVADNKTGALDSAGERDPWIELYNSGSVDVDLGVYYLSNDPERPALWQFPLGTIIRPGQFLVVWADGQPEQSLPNELHTNFRISPPGGVIALMRLQFGSPGAVDYVYYTSDFADQSFGSIEDGDPTTRRPLFVPTPGGANNPGDMLVPVTINEWMSSNTRIITDPADGDFDDWFELYNAGPNIVDLTGYFISDSATNVTQFRIPSGYKIAPGGFMLVWADEETAQNSTNHADLHVNFKLSKDGESLYLFTPNAAMVDGITFISQNDNASGGRYPDGAEAFFNFTSASPRTANVAPPGTRFTIITVDAGQLLIGWRSTAGKTYRLEAKNDLSDANWTPVGNTITATGTTASARIDFSEAGNRFFRIAQVN